MEAGWVVYRDFHTLSLGPGEMGIAFSSCTVYSSHAEVPGMSLLLLGVLKLQSYKDVLGETCPISALERSFEI